MAETTREKAILAAKAADEKKAKDIVILDISRISTVADYFVILSVANSPQMQAVIDNIEDRMIKAGYGSCRREGDSRNPWVLLDYGDVVVHLFREEERNFYNLERLWGDAERITL
ncbi:MAG: ribosome-associated protein [Eubacteriales bacterium]|nr:ribosome-associated protein [Eubacteriales bacterium]MDN5364043.1 ribosome-associated protein [Eubacteriales bacterium]